MTRRFYPTFTCAALPPAFYGRVKQWGKAYDLDDRGVIMLAIAAADYLQALDSDPQSLDVFQQLIQQVKQEEGRHAAQSA